MGQSLIRQVQNAIQEQGLMRAGERVGVAISGGADSVALLLLLLELRAKLGVVLSVAHFNHKLRGKAADADARFVEKLAAKHGLAFHGGQADVAARSKRDKSNLEDTARRSRYEFFAALVKAGHFDKIAVAHTMDDQAETVLAHIFRGTGLAGLGGIHPVVEHVVRPLLAVRRAELRAYLRRKKQAWREDATNLDVRKMRARIRKNLVPILEKQFQPAVVQHLATLAELAREDEAFLEAFVEQRARTDVEKDAHSAIVRACDLLDLRAYRIREENANAGTQRTLRSAERKFLNSLLIANKRQTSGTETEVNLAVSRRMVRRIVKEVKPRGGQLGAEHVRAVLELAQRRENGKKLQLPGGLTVRREHDSLIFGAAENIKTAHGSKACEFAHAIQLDGQENDIPVPELSCVFRVKVIDWPAERGETSKSEAVLDRDALRSPVVLRNWRPGDRFQPLGHRNAHKLKRLLNRKHIDLSEREGWPVLTSGEVIVWVRGFPVAAKFAAGEKTRTGIVIEETVL